MLFNTSQFFAFLAIVLILFYTAPRVLRKYILLAASYFFYMSFIPKFILLLLSLTAIDYTAARWIARTHSPHGRKVALIVSLNVWNEFLISSQLSSDATQPVTVAIASFTGSQPHEEPYTTIMAAGTIVTIPIIILVLVFQRRIVAGLTAGGVKG